MDRYTKAQAPGNLKVLLSGESVKLLQRLTRQVPIANDIKKRAVDVVRKTREKPDLIEYGASPRAAMGIVMAAKARALIDGRKYVSVKDIEEMAFPVLRHRIILNFKAERDGKTTDDVIKELLK